MPYTPDMSIRPDHRTIYLAREQHDESWRNAEQHIKRQAVLVVGLQVSGC